MDSGMEGEEMRTWCSRMQCLAAQGEYVLDSYHIVYFTIIIIIMCYILENCEKNRS
jgi:hypothetical protein